MHKRQRIFAIIVFSIILLLIWYPVVLDNHVPTLPISNDVVSRSREIPGKSVLDELSKFQFGPFAPMTGNELISAAEKIMLGYLQLPGYKPVSIGVPFDSMDLEKGLPTWQLAYCGMIVPDILIEAYLLSGKDEYFHLASKVILAWAKFEKSQWLPKGFLWNDHAIASRVAVLGKFWSVYRERHDYKIDVAKLILEMASRSGEMLAKDGQFTFATNHGVMQNLALLHLASVFPEIPNVHSYRSIATERLSDQMLFYINDEGIVLEHSAGYHSHGMELMGKAFRYFAINNINPPRAWVEKYKKSKDFMSMIHRPDGSLPVFGNTNGASILPSLITEVDSQGGAIPLFLKNNWRPNASHSLYPVAGYSVWWDNLSSSSSRLPSAQTVMVWSYFQMHGHKLADEMSLLIWANSQTWLSNVGYWPYGLWGRVQADSWEGSNAPHLLRETADSARQTELLDYVVDGRVAFNHLRRNGPPGFSVDRQVLHIDSDLWLVLDHQSDKDMRRVSTTWTFFPNLEVENGALPEQYNISRSDAKSCMSIFISGKNKIEIKKYTGSAVPFSGWVVLDNKPRQAPSLIVEQKADDSWSLTLLSLEQNCKGRLRKSPRLMEWQSLDRWKIDIPLNEGIINIRRLGSELYIGNKLYGIREGGAAEGHSTNQTAMARSMLENSFNFASKKYKKNHDLIEYRKKITYLLFVAFLFQEVLLYISPATLKEHLYALRIASIVGWIGVGGWLFLVYFST